MQGALFAKKRERVEAALPRGTRRAISAQPGNKYQQGSRGRRENLFRFVDFRKRKGLIVFQGERNKRRLRFPRPRGGDTKHGEGVKFIGQKKLQ